ncbi:hypothetical protein BJ508DRAFT_332746 [Ascobolus immersus RN42]|uniref:Uncharacterized protein n=1 Tax=Ascobolus immersus RN42 TaxID=1160509 RepID=A0A3N4HQN6_ASCIM|nr:hypothetical protein BJ508DRAFT_332746 [Ascobolus immersus RN42]
MAPQQQAVKPTGPIRNHAHNQHQFWLTPYPHLPVNQLRARRSGRTNSEDFDDLQLRRLRQATGLQVPQLPQRAVSAPPKEEVDEVRKPQHHRSLSIPGKATNKTDSSSVGQVAMSYHDQLLQALQDPSAFSTSVSSTYRLTATITRILEDILGGASGPPRNQALLLLSAMDSVLKVNQHVVEAIRTDLEDSQRWTTLIMSIFEQSPKLYAVLVDAVPLWNLLEGLDYTKCLHKRRRTTVLQPPEVTFVTLSNGRRVKTYSEHVPTILASSVEGYGSSTAQIDAVSISPLLVEILIRCRKPLAVGPVRIGHSMDRSFAALAVIGLDMDSLLFASQQSLPFTNLPLVFLAGDIEHTSGSSSPDARGTLKGLISAFRNSSQGEDDDAWSSVNQIKASQAEKLQGDIDIGRSVSRFDHNGKGTIAAVVRVCERMFVLTANHVLNSGSYEPAPMSSRVMIPANLELMKTGHLLGFDRSSGAAEVERKAGNVVELLTSGPHGTVECGNLGTDEHGNREDWVLCSVDDPSRIRDEAKWSEESIEMLGKAFSEPLPDELSLETVGRRVAVEGEVVLKMGAQGGPLLGTVGSDQWRTYRLNSWEPYNPLPSSIPVNDSPAQEAISEDEEIPPSEDIREPGEAIAGVEWCRFTSVCSVDKSRGYGECGDSGCGVHGAKQAQVSEQTFYESICSGDGVCLIGQLVTVVNGGQFGTVGLMVRQEVLFDQMEKATGDVVDLVR